MKFEQLTLKTRLPDWRSKMPVFLLAPAPLEERHATARRLGDGLKLGTLRAAELEHGLVLASERGDITVFHASGALWARDATVSAEAKDELRSWPGLVPPAAAGQDFTLSADAGKRVTTMAQELLRQHKLLGREAGPPTVQLEQVSQLDAKGNELQRGAGQATVKFAYTVEGVAVRGAGAKTLMFVEPGSASSSAPRVAGVFHAWRALGEAVAVKLQPLEAALSVAVLQDPELDRYAQAGHAIQVNQLELVYLALPAFLRQSHLFPALQIEGEVAKGKLGEGFHFARFHHVVPPADYAAAGLHGPYLSLNPDGITPRAARNVLN